MKTTYQNAKPKSVTTDIKFHYEIGTGYSGLVQVVCNMYAQFDGEDNWQVIDTDLLGNVNMNSYRYFDMGHDDFNEVNEYLDCLGNFYVKLEVYDEQMSELLDTIIVPIWAQDEPPTLTQATKMDSSYGYTLGGYNYYQFNCEWSTANEVDVISGLTIEFEQYINGTGWVYKQSSELSPADEPAFGHKQILLNQLYHSSGSIRYKYIWEDTMGVHTGGWVNVSY